MVRFFLVFIAVVYGAFGGFGLADPVGMLSGMGVEASGRNALVELRGLYGGVSVAAALLALAGAVLTSLARPALWVVLVLNGGYVLGRLVSLALDGAPSPLFLGIWGFEAVIAGLAVASLAQGRDRAGRA